MEYLFSNPYAVTLVIIIVWLAIWAFMRKEHKPSTQALRYQLVGELHALEEGIMSVDATIGRCKNKPDSDASAREKARAAWRNAVDVHQALISEFTIDSDEAAINSMIARVETGRVFLREARAALPDCWETPDEALIGRHLLDDVGSQIVGKRD
jgi:hypothetical protein